MGLFSKKQCSICGADIGLLSNKKLADGNVCKNCRAKFSPFWDADRGTTVQEVLSHLQYRERNRAALAGFTPTMQVGSGNILYIDARHGKFVLCEQRELPGANPDVFDLSSIRNCSYDIQEHEYTDDENRASDYYEYEFFLVIELNHPQFRQIGYHVNEKTVTSRRLPIRHQQAEQIYTGEKEMRGHFLSALTGIDRRAMEEYVGYYAVTQEMIRALTQAAQAWTSQPTIQQAAPVVPAQPAAAAPAIPAQPITPAQSAPQQAKFCTNCGGKLNAGAKFCPQCGAKL